MDVKEKDKGGRRFSLSAKRHSRESELREGMDADGKVKICLSVFAVIIGFLFGGCHIVFGAYPLGLAFVCALPGFVWYGLLGVVCGALTLGKSGIIYGMICVLAVFVRVIISSGGAKMRDGIGKDRKLFGESATLRACSAVIGGFVTALYEILLEGLGTQTVLFGASMIVLPAAITYLLCGAFYRGIGVRELALGGARVFYTSNNSRESVKIIFFKVSLLAFIFFISLSLERFNLFGIDISYIFAAAVSIFAAKRFGPLYGAVVGFVSAVGLSGLYSVAFALLGAASGALFAFGAIYSLIGGGVVLSLWGAYADGVVGFLSLFPEFLIAACAMMPLLRYLERDSAPSMNESVRRKATDMVGTMALAYRNKKVLAIEELENSCAALVPIISEFCNNDIMNECYTVFSKLVSEAKNSMMQDREMDEELTDALENAFAECGFYDGVIRAFGTRRKYVICAGEDKAGIRITSPSLRMSIEETTGLRFSEPEYFRRDDMVLMECESTKKYELRGAYAKAANSHGEVSGDTARVFESKDLFAYGVICDGMGSGNEAKRTSEFIAGFLEVALGMKLSYTTLVHMLNSVVRRNREECGAALDLFAFDEISGEATFLKSGAAPSYIKRSGSLFRIKSETMPLGFIKQVDAEKIVVSVNPNDYIIMVSDGVCQVGEDAPWLIDILNMPPREDLGEYASFILDEAKKNGKGEDDITVLVMKPNLL